MAAKRRKGGKGRSKARRRVLRLGLFLLAALVAWGVASEWYVHHPRRWLAEKRASLPAFVTAPLCFFGNPLADLTDALDWTGHDAVYEYDTEAPSGSTTFAGVPARVRAPAPGDIRVVDRGEFVIGWSDSLRHPVWVAYHVVKDAKHKAGKRPGFVKDASLPAAPAPADYTKSGYDRGHMAPNYAIATRYGTEAQKKTFAMSNVAPQTPALNRGVWRDVEHRIADLWTARYGEIWVVVGCISPMENGKSIGGTGIDIPVSYYQIIIAQEGMNVRALAVLFPQTVPWNAWAARNIVTIEELEEMTGLDFNPELPGFIQRPLESELPSRLWPVRVRDIFRLVSLWFGMS